MLGGRFDDSRSSFVVIHVLFRSTIELCGRRFHVRPVSPVAAVYRRRLTAAASEKDSQSSRKIRYVNTTHRDVRSTGQSDSDNAK